ncbi:MAG TPA: hypothetical protein VLL08_03755 [Kineosporiaceae bacterium]|nr:hypothetical protein [Kineosporiaceae bacterium]
MDEPGHIAGIVGPLLTMFGAGLIVLSLILTSVKGGFTTGFSLTPWSPLSRRLRECARGQASIPSEELPILQAVARVWVGQRSQLLFCLGASIAQFGSSLGYSGVWRDVFTVAFTALMAATAVLTERRARLGAAFLASHPLPGPPNPPEYLSGPQPGSV